MPGRFRYISKPYNNESIKCLRSPRQKSLSSKLYSALRQNFETKNASVTFGMMDPVQVIQAAKTGLTSIYVSGWQCSSTASSTHEPGPDFADYPYDTVPEKVKQLRKALDFHTRIQKATGTSNIDYDIPIIADGDTGHGGPTAIMKLTKLMIENGAAGIHLEDQHSENKRCGHLGGKILVSTQKHIDRLMAARLQADILNDPLVIIARTDAESACFVDSDTDSRDVPFISGKRTHEGYFPIESGNEYAIHRSLAYAPYSDLIWIETHRPDLDQARIFSERIHAKYPHVMLAYNLSPSFNWDSENLDENQLKSFTSDLAKLGYVWQFITLAGFHLNALATTVFTRDFIQYPVYAYVKNIQREERKHQVETLKHQEWSGIDLRVKEVKTIMDQSNQVRSKGMTEDKF